MAQINLRSVGVRVFDDATGELLDAATVGAESEAVELIRQVLEREGRRRLRVESALGYATVIQHFEPAELTP